MTTNDTAYTITLTETELSMLVEATNIMHFRYNKPNMTEAAHKGAQKYADLCAKLYGELLKQTEKA